MTEQHVVFRRQSWLHHTLHSVHGMLSLGIIASGLVMFVGPAIMAGWQVLTWLRHGYWDRWPIERTLAQVGILEPQTGWAGVQKIISYIFGMPTWLLIMFGGLIVGGLLIQIVGWIDDNHLADARVTYSLDGKQQQRIIRGIFKGKDMDAILAVWRIHPEGGFKVTKVEWLPRG